MGDVPDPSELREFDARLKAARKSTQPERRTVHAHSNAGAAWRMIIELVTGMVMGFGIGYAVDSFFGTLPIFLVFFSLIGFGAGVRVMMQTAKETQRDSAAKAAEAKDET